MSGPGDRRAVGLILAATVVVGGLGAIAGVAFDPDPVKDGGAAPPKVAAAAASGGGQSDLRLPSTLTGGVLADEQRVVRGSFFTLSFGTQIFIPEKWTVYQSDELRVWAKSGDGDWVFAATGQLGQGTTVTASDLITQNLQGLLPPDNYTQLQTKGPEAWADPFGTVTSTSVLSYEAIWVDDQGSVSIHGQIYAAMKNDGTALIILAEHVPAADWGKQPYPLFDVVEQSMIKFGGIG